ncbi:MAG: N-6 DNA methylase [Lewinellaceae bacterium]|nr:N-6 DNA methylase [Lewinellaceae bacterium]
MLDTSTKKRIDDCRDILVGKLPDPKAQIEQITIGLIYKFMDDMDKEAIELGGSAKFFSGDYEKYAWDKLFDTKVTAAEMLRLYSDAIESMEKNPNIPQLFRDIFNNAYLPYRDPETLKLFLKTIGEFEYTHSEKLGDAFEYLLSVMGSQGDAGQFRTPRHIIDFLVAIVDPDKGETILDPACGTAGFLISAYKHILLKHTKANKEGLNIYEYNKLEKKPFNNLGDALTPDDRNKLIQNFAGYDISPDMVRLSLVNLYLHGFSDPHINEYDTLSSEDRWNENFDVVLANPPFMSPKGGIRPHKKFTIASNRSEVLFVDYIAEHLNPKGKAGIIVPEGVIFQSGSAYKDLRKLLVENYLYAVVSLPAGVFNPYSGVKTSILLMDKALARQRDEILFVKIDNDGYNLGAQRTAVKGSQLEEAIAITHEFVASGELSDSLIAHAVLRTEIAANGDYNLSGERYRINEIINSDFELVPLSEIAEISSGNSAPQDKDLFENGTYPFCRTSDVGRVHLSSDFSDINDLLNEKGINGLRLFKKGTILFPKSGASTFLNHRVRLGIDSYVSSHLATIFADEQKISSLFMYHVLCTIDARTLTNDQNYPSLKLSEIGQIKIPLPPLSIQEEIVAEIEGYQKIIDGAKAVVANYKPKIDIDPDWEMVELQEVCSVTSGGTPDRKNSSYWNGDIPYVKTGEIFFNRIEHAEEFITEDGLNNSSARLINPGTILMAMYGQGVTRGRVAILEIEAAINQAVAAISCSDKIDNVFLFYQLMGLYEHLRTISDARGGNQSNLNAKLIKELKIVVPDLETQRQIVAQIEKEQALVNANKQLIEIFEQKIKDRIAKVWGE